MIVFGLPGVLTDLPSAGDRALIQRIARRSDDQFWVDYDAHRPLYDKGELTGEEYWRRVAPDAPNAAALVEADTASLVSCRPDMMALVDELSGPKAILANVPLPVARAVDTASWATHFAHRVYSADIGFVKPDRGAYRALCAQVGLDPADLLLVDDRWENVAAARAFGMPSLLFTGSAALRTALQPAWLSRPSPLSGRWW